MSCIAQHWLQKLPAPGPRLSITACQRCNMYGEWGVVPRHLSEPLSQAVSTPGKHSHITRQGVWPGRTRTCKLLDLNPMKPRQISGMSA